MRSIVTFFGVVVAGISILPKNPMDYFIQLFKFILKLINRKKNGKNIKNNMR